MEPLQTVLVSGAVALIVGTVPAVLLFLLQRKGANKKLELDQTSTAATVFDAQTKAYKELYDTANAATAAALKELATYKEERTRLMAQVEEQGKKIKKLEESDDLKTDELADARRKVEQLRSLFTAILARTGIEMTPEEQAIFEATKPKWLIKEITEGRTDAQ